VAVQAVTRVRTIDANEAGGEEIFERLAAILRNGRSQQGWCETYV